MFLKLDWLDFVNHYIQMMNFNFKNLFPKEEFPKIPEKFLNDVLFKKKMNFKRKLK